ncbi:hypothetical protein EVAR_100340_1 [Eumeta japonica]|uniref:Uncharacterized protein n=1 Tax=Eumeta variegata TaxID=151549 RepID=A0A4C2AGR0_EUMVA|nr:hypothetical protein EVAR_100340_1 [Eumeta japonica]
MAVNGGGGPPSPLTTRDAGTKSKRKREPREKLKSNKAGAEREMAAARWRPRGGGHQAAGAARLAGGGCGRPRARRLDAARRRRALSADGGHGVA